MAPTKKKILIVDDEDNITWSMEKFLSKEGYFIATADSAKKGAELLNASPFELVITDMKMPDVDGFQFLNWIKKNHPKSKVVIMTAFGSNSIREEAKKIGAYRYFEKPVDLNQLRKFINETLADKGFTGNILDIDLFDFVQMVLLSRKQKLISITDPVSMQMGLLYLKHGDVIHAEVGATQGEQAFYTILAMKSGIFSDMPWIDPPVRTINAPFNHLIMEAARIQDESQANMQDLEATVEAVKKVLEKQKGKDTEVKGGEAVKQVLSAMRNEFPDINALMVFNARDGRFVEGLGNDGLNLNESAVIFKNVFTTSGDGEVMLNSKAERRRQVEEVMISNENDISIIKKIKEGRFTLFINFAKTANIGMLKIGMNNYILEIEHHL
ncbi:MAG: response regulator [Candidatus Sericytochromatia bacterium]